MDNKPTTPQNAMLRPREASIGSHHARNNPVLKGFGSLTILGFSCTVLITWECCLFVFNVGLQNGGPAALIYSFLIVWIGTLSVFVSLSELVFMAPRSSGQYHWVALLATPSTRKVLSYVTGWLTMCGWQALSATAAIILATLIQGVTALMYPSYQAQWKNWHGTLLSWLAILVSVFINTLVARWLPKFEAGFLVLHILGFFAILLPLVFLADHTDSEFVFETFTWNGGWSSHGVAFCIGMMGNVLAFLGGDAAMHMSEEIKNAQTVVPWSILFSILINGTLGIGIVIAVLYFVSNLDLAMKEAPMFPIMSIFRQATGSRKAAAAMSSLFIVMTMSALVNVTAAASRLVWAFARDRGLPGWRRTEKVDARTGIPLTAVLITSVTSILLTIVNIGDPAAFNGVVSLTIASLFVSYLLAVGLLLYRRLKGDILNCELSKQPIDTDSDADIRATDADGTPLTWGPWKVLGAFGTANNIFACCYLIFILFFSFWPANYPVTPQNMNWAILVTGVVVIFSTIYYLVWARKTYIVPKPRIGTRNDVLLLS